MPVWKSTGGQLLGKAFAKAAQWTVNPQTFPYYASNHGKLQDTQNGSYFPLLLRYYPNKDAEQAIKDGDTKADSYLLVPLFEGGAPGAAGSASSTGSATSSSAGTSSASTSGASTPTSGTSSKCSSSHTGRIVGIAAAGVVALAALGLLITRATRA